LNFNQANVVDLEKGLHQCIRISSSSFGVHCHIYKF
jgi:hypothetical protein